MGLLSPSLPGDPCTAFFPYVNFCGPADPYLLFGDKPPPAHTAPVPMALNDICLTAVHRCHESPFLQHPALSNHPNETPRVPIYSLHRPVSTSAPPPRQSHCTTGVQRRHGFLGKSPP